jgi:hypothetical protein
MAQKVSIVLVDDIDGSEADETVTFGLDGTTYEIDLSDEHATALRDSLAEYVGYARKVAATRRSSGSSGRKAAASVGASAADIREWAKEQGYEVSERGRINAGIREAYDAAH